MLASLIAKFNLLSEPACRALNAHAAKIDAALLALSAATIAFAFFPNSVALTGSLALNLLWILLFLPILSKVFAVRLATACMRFRKTLGILMGMLATVHAAAYFVNWGSFSPLRSGFWIYEGVPTFLAYGMVALVFTALLLVTSNAVSMRIMGGKRWKLLHRTAYLIAVLTVAHVSMLEWAKHGHPDIPGIALLTLFCAGKWAEWTGRKVAPEVSGVRG